MEVNSRQFPPKSSGYRFLKNGTENNRKNILSKMEINVIKRILIFFGIREFDTRRL